MKPDEYFTPEEKQRILDAIAQAEKETSGEIRVHIEKDCKTDVLDRAAYLFATLGMHKTKLRNGVLIYVAMEDRKFAILGDAGINARVPAGFWDHVSEVMVSYFREGKLAEGLAEGIRLAGEQLKQYFPWQEGDANELKDDISYGEETGQ